MPTGVYFRSDETKRQIAERLKRFSQSTFKGFHHTPESKRKMSLAKKGKPLLEATKRKMSKARKGKKGYIWTEADKNKMSNIKKGQIPWIVGKHHTAEAKEKMRKAKLGKTLSADHKRKIGEANKDKPHSEEWKKKIGLANKDKIRTEEMKKRWSKAQQGSKSHCWRGGISFEPYSVDWTETLKRAIRERDHYTCQLCGALQSDTAFDVHHKDYNKKNCNPDNLVTLCNPCHMKTNFNREKWIEYFKHMEVKND
jgi:hypothetical protein